MSRHRNLLVFLMLFAVSAFVAACEFSSTDKKATDGDTPTDGDAPDGDEPDGDEPDGDEPVETVLLKQPASWVTTPATHTPLHVRQSWLQDPATTVTISWRTVIADGKVYTPKVWYAETAMLEGKGDDAQLPYSDRLVASGTGFFYTAYHENTKDYAFVLWSVEITGLKPATDYAFRAGTFDSVDLDSLEMKDPNLSPIHHFRTAPVKGSRTPFRFMSAGDSRGAYDKITENAARLTALDLDFWIFNGDMTNGGSAAEWISWFDAMNPILNNHVFMPVQGNHEFIAELYYNQFALPKMRGLLPEELDKHAWSFNYGNAHVVGLNSITTDVVEKQVAWLDADLKAARNDPDIDWIFVMFHHPAYSASKKHGSTDRIITSFVPVFERYNVDVAFSGHDHNYERSCAVRGGNCRPDGDGVVYIVVGGFYADGYSNGTDWWTLTSFHGDLHNYMVLDVDGKNLTAVAYDGAGNELDRLTLSK